MPDITNPKVFAELMREAFSNLHDIEASHADADTLMCDLLKKLGYTEAVEIFQAADKWYA